MGVPCSGSTANRTPIARGKPSGVKVERVATEDNSIIVLETSAGLGLLVVVIVWVGGGGEVAATEDKIENERRRWLRVEVCGLNWDDLWGRWIVDKEWLVVLIVMGKNEECMEWLENIELVCKFIFFCLVRWMDFSYGCSVLVLKMNTRMMIWLIISR